MNLFLEEKERLSEFRFKEQTFYYLIVPKNLCPVHHCMCFFFILFPCFRLVCFRLKFGYIFIILEITPKLCGFSI